MRRIVAWIAGAAGGVAAYRLLRRWGAELETWPEPAAAEPDARAEELRAKLAESREEERPAAEVASPESPDERRRRVHEEGRAAIDEMQSE
jgi:hypothetical protein